MDSYIDGSIYSTHYILWSLSASGIWSKSATIIHSNGQPGCLNHWTWSFIVESDISSLINVLSCFLCLITNLPQVFALSCALWKSSAIFPNIHWDSGWIGDLHLDGLDTVLSVLGKVLWKGRRPSDVTSRRLTLMRTEQASCHIWKLSFADGPLDSLLLSSMREMLENLSRACRLSCLVHR